jgi:hypothetical protein
VQIHWPRPNRKLGTLDALGILGAMGLLVARFIPIARLIPGWGCPLRERTGWPCPGCGLTRVADRVAHFNFAGAWDANPLGTVFAVFFAFAALYSFLHLAFRVPVPDVSLSEREHRWSVRGLVALVVVNYAFVIIKAKFPALL